MTDISCKPPLRLVLFGKTGARNISEILKRATGGDIIELEENRYAIFIGDGEVVHLGSSDRSLSEDTRYGNNQVFEKAVVRKDKLLDLVGNSEAKINNFLDSVKKPLPPREIVRRALSCLGQGGYNVIKKNSQNFVSWCRYGEASSEPS